MTIAHTAGRIELGRTQTFGRTQATSERLIVTFAIVQLFLIIYLQRIALSPSLSVPLVMMIGGMCLGIALRWFGFGDVYRVAAYLFFLMACLISESFAQGRIISLLQLVAIYSCWTVNTTISDAAYRRILNAFNLMMIVPAIIIVFQFAYQKLTGLTNPLTMTGLVPDSLIVQGYAYDLHYPWNSPFIRPNGFFFLEPSFSSMFAAIAAILEIMYFRRWYLILLMIVATFTSQGATGVTMLFIAAPFLLSREKASVVFATIAGALAALILAIALDVPLPVISRTDELNAQNSSGGERLMLPLLKFGDLVLDPAYIISGDGAGSDLRDLQGKRKITDPKKTKNAVASLWPMVKVLAEYGVIAMCAYLILFGTAMRERFCIPLKIALSVEFLFTGGYLVTPPFVGILTFLFVFITPASAATRQKRV